MMRMGVGFVDYGGNESMRSHDLIWFDLVPITKARLSPSAYDNHTYSIIVQPPDSHLEASIRGVSSL